MKNYYFAVTVTEDGKNCAYVIKASESENLLCVFQRVKNATAINLFPTKKKAAEIADYWNECFKNNGTYIFDKIEKPLF